MATGTIEGIRCFRVFRGAGSFRCKVQNLFGMFWGSEFWVEGASQSATGRVGERDPIKPDRLRVETLRARWGGVGSSTLNPQGAYVAPRSWLQLPRDMRHSLRGLGPQRV